MNCPYTIYGVYDREEIVYVGCTRNLKTRIPVLLKENRALRRIKSRLTIRPLAGARTRRRGHIRETLIISDLIKNGARLYNITPSVKLNPCGGITRSWKINRSRVRSEVGGEITDYSMVTLSPKTSRLLRNAMRALVVPTSFTQLANHAIIKGVAIIKGAATAEKFFRSGK